MQQLKAMDEGPWRVALQKAWNDYLKFYCSYLKNGSPFKVWGEKNYNTLAAGSSFCRCQNSSLKSSA